MSVKGSLGERHKLKVFRAVGMLEAKENEATACDKTLEELVGIKILSNGELM
jgi:hypothetical protein